MLLFLFRHHNFHFIVSIDDIIMHYFLELSHVLCIVLFYFPLFWWSFIIECSLGSYGYNCNQLCDGCLSDSCDNKNGVCTNTTGCTPGRQHVDPWKCDIGMNTIYYVCIAKVLFVKLLTFQENNWCSHWWFVFILDMNPNIWLKPKRSF